MAHPAQGKFCLSVRERFPEYFTKVKVRENVYIILRVMDLGSLDINGNNRYLFAPSCYEYFGVDIAEGENVDIVSLIHELNIPQDGAMFDVVICTETLEHDMHYKKSIPHMVKLLRPGGLLIITCGSHKREVHGVRGNGEADSPFTVKIPGWDEWFHGISDTELKEILEPDKHFQQWEMSLDRDELDLNFWGIKKS